MAFRLVATLELTKKCTGVHSEFPFPLSTGREEGRRADFQKNVPWDGMSNFLLLGSDVENLGEVFCLGVIVNI